jgi:membrane-bound lytic murein transglycosylase B
MVKLLGLSAAALGVLGAGALGVVATSGGAETTAIAQSGAAISAPPPASARFNFEPSGDRQFDVWRDAFALRAIAAGRSFDMTRQMLNGLTPEPRAVAADRNQAEFVRPVWDYIDRAVSARRVSEGQARVAENRSVLNTVEARFGVDPAVIAGIWAIETNFGTASLPHDAARAIATLAAEGRRRDQFERYLLALIEMVERGYAQPGELRSSWAGALGQPQFMPDVFLELAVDFDGDGRRDIWNNRGDIFGSIANYLKTKGWRRGAPVFDEVRLPNGFDYALADGAGRTIADWTALGVRTLAGAALATDAGTATLFLPAGHRGPALLLYPNFAVIRTYNPSDRYALAVALLAQGFRGDGGLRTPWPRDMGALDRAQTITLQQSLAALGFSPGSADGMFGANTRRAVRTYQQSKGLPADGYPTPALLARITGEAAAAERAGIAAASPALNSDGVKALQRAFNRAGIRVGLVDGEAGTATIRAIRTLERRLGLPQTGNPTEFILAETEKLPAPTPQRRASPKKKKRR